MKWIARWSLTLLLALSFSSAIEAEVACDPGETMIECWTRVMKENKSVEAAVTTQETDLIAKEKEDLKDKPTGVETGDANLRSNTSDFLPVLALSGLLGNAKEGDAEGTYVIDLNFLIPSQIKEHNSKLQAVVNSQPQLSDGIKKQLPEDRRDELTKALDEGLGDLSDYSLSYSFNWNDSRHGRGFDQYRSRIAALAFAVARNFKLPDSAADALRKLGDLSKQVSVNPGEDPFKKPFSAMGAQGTIIQQAVERAIAQELDLLEIHRKAWREAGLGSLGDLLDNQPQLTISAQRRFRDPVAGGDEDSIKISYERGFANFNSALKGGCEKNLETAHPDKVTTLDECLGDFTAYVNGHKDEIKNGGKISFSAEYMNVDEKVFDLSEQELTGLKINAARKLIIKGGWSRLFSSGKDGETPLRFDLVGSYEDVSDDPQRQDRGVATLTITRQFGDIAIPFGIVYANHGEFLGEVDEQFSAHLGLKFDFEPGNGD